MILSLNILSPLHMQEVYGHYPQAIYGLAMHYDREFPYSTLLAQGEDLFVTGHGAHCSIGHRYGSPRFNPMDFSDWLKESVLPWDYHGNIHISADGLSPEFIDRLLHLMGSDYEGRIHGLFEYGEHRLARPGSGNWMSAVA